MQDYILDFAISTFITFLRTLTVDSKKKWKKVVLKVFKEIAKQFGDDKEFRDVLK